MYKVQTTVQSGRTVNITNVWVPSRSAWEASNFDAASTAHYDPKSLMELSDNQVEFYRAVL